MIEGGAWRALALDEPLSLALALHLERAVVAILVVPGASEEDERRPRASGPTRVRVVASAAVTPERVDRAITRVTERLRALPDLSQGSVANVASGPRLRRQRRTALDAAIGFDAEHRLARAARSRMPEHG